MGSKSREVLRGRGRSAGGARERVEVVLEQ